MRHITARAVGLRRGLVVALAAGCGNAIAPFDGVYDFRVRFESGDTVRAAVVHVPPAYDGVSPLPLLLAFHGSGSTGEEMQAETGLDAVADSLAFIVAYPDGAPNWDVEGDRDVRFARDLIDHLRGRLGIAPDRIYATGFSAGGSFTTRLACDEAGRFAAVGIVASTMSHDLAEGCHPDRRITTALVVGTVDLLVPIGGDATSGRLSADSTIGIFARRNGCEAADRQVAYEPDALADGRRVRREAYAGCRDGTETVLWVVEVGNHSWYRGDVDTGLLLAELLLRHRR
jgi:polyhydroxybutyrate depolymerase